MLCCLHIFLHLQPFSCGSGRTKGVRVVFHVSSYKRRAGLGPQRAPSSHPQTLLQQDGNSRQGQDEQSLPDSGRKHSLEFGYSSIDGDEELDVV